MLTGNLLRKHSFFSRLVTWFVILTFIPINSALPLYISTGKKHESILKRFQGVSSPEAMGPISDLPLDELLNITIPETFGVINERFEGKDKRMVIVSQDIHANYEAQSNFAKIMDFFQKGKTRGNLDLITLEGAAGEVTPDIFGRMVEKDIRAQVADYFMGQGYLNGADYFMINSDATVKVRGIEDPALYRQNLACYRKTQALKAGMSETLSAMGRIVDMLRAKIFTPELIEATDKERQLENGKIEFTAYCQFLAMSCMKHGVAVDAYKNFSLMIQTLNIEKGLDNERVKDERKQLVEQLQAKLVKEDAKELVTKTLYFRLGRLKATDYYAMLCEQAKKAGIDMSAPGFKNLLKHMDKVKVYEQIQMDQLMTEVHALTEGIKDKLYRNPEQRELGKLTRHLLLLGRLVNLELTREEFHFIKEHRSEFDGNQYVALLKRLAGNVGISAPVSDDWAKLTDGLEEMEGFYDAAVSRDDVLINNTLETMDKEKKRAAVLVAGGFHAQGIARKLKEKGISYLFMIPKITKDEGDAIYVARMMNEVPPLMEYLMRKASRLQIVNFLAKNVGELDPNSVEIQQKVKDLAGILYSLNASVSKAGALDTSRLSRELGKLLGTEASVDSKDNVISIQVGDGPAVSVSLNVRAKEAGDLVAKIRVGNAQFLFAKVAEIENLGMGEKHALTDVALSQIAALGARAGETASSTSVTFGNAAAVGGAQNAGNEAPVVSLASDKSPMDAFKEEIRKILNGRLVADGSLSARLDAIDQAGNLTAINDALEALVKYMNEAKVKGPFKSSESFDYSQEIPLARQIQVKVQAKMTDSRALAAVPEKALKDRVENILDQRLSADLTLRMMLDEVRGARNLPAMKDALDRLVTYMDGAKAKGPFKSSESFDYSKEIPQVRAVSGEVNAQIAALGARAGETASSTSVTFGNAAAATARATGGVSAAAAPQTMSFSPEGAHAAGIRFNNFYDAVSKGSSSLSNKYSPEEMNQLASALGMTSADFMALKGWQVASNAEQPDAHFFDFEGRRLDAMLDPSGKTNAAILTEGLIKAVLIGDQRAIGIFRGAVNHETREGIAHTSFTALGISHETARPLAHLIGMLSEDSTSQAQRERLPEAQRAPPQQAGAKLSARQQDILKNATDDYLRSLESNTENSTQKLEAVLAKLTPAQLDAAKKEFNKQLEANGLQHLGPQESILDAAKRLANNFREQAIALLKSREANTLANKVRVAIHDGNMDQAQKDFVATVRADYKTSVALFNGLVAEGKLNGAQIKAFMGALKTNLDQSRYKKEGENEAQAVARKKEEIQNLLSSIDSSLAADAGVLVDQVYGLLKDLKIDYHNIQHTLEVALGTAQTVVQQFKRGQLKDAKSVLLAVTAALFHDIGYSNSTEVFTKLINDETQLNQFYDLLRKAKGQKGDALVEKFKTIVAKGQAGKLSGAELTQFHVYLGQFTLQSKLNELNKGGKLAQGGYLVAEQSIEAINAMVSLTDIAPESEPYRKDRRAHLLAQAGFEGVAAGELLALGEALETNDLMTQMATADYFAKGLPLFFEFFFGDASAMWTSGLELLAKTTGFYEFFAKARFNPEVMARLDEQSGGYASNLYRSNLEMALFFYQTFGGIYGKLVQGKPITKNDMDILKGLQENGLPSEVVDLFQAAKALQEGRALDADLKGRLEAVIGAQDSPLDIGFGDEIRMTLMRDAAIRGNALEVKNILRGFHKLDVLANRAVDLQSTIALLQSAGQDIQPILEKITALAANPQNKDKLLPILASIQAKFDEQVQILQTAEDPKGLGMALIQKNELLGSMGLTQLMKGGYRVLIAEKEPSMVFSGTTRSFTILVNPKDGSKQIVITRGFLNQLLADKELSEFSTEFNPEKANKAKEYPSKPAIAALQNRLKVVAELTQKGLLGLEQGASLIANITEGLAKEKAPFGQLNGYAKPTGIAALLEAADALDRAGDNSALRGMFLNQARTLADAGGVIVTHEGTTTTRVQFGEGKIYEISSSNFPSTRGFSSSQNAPAETRLGQNFRTLMMELALRSVLSGSQANEIGNVQFSGGQLSFDVFGETYYLKYEAGQPVLGRQGFDFSRGTGVLQRKGMMRLNLSREQLQALGSLLSIKALQALQGPIQEYTRDPERSRNTALASVALFSKEQLGQYLSKGQRANIAQISNALNNPGEMPATPLALLTATVADERSRVQEIQSGESESTVKARPVVRTAAALPSVREEEADITTRRAIENLRKRVRESRDSKDGLMKEADFNVEVEKIKAIAADNDDIGWLEAEYKQWRMQAQNASTEAMRTQARAEQAVVRAQFSPARTQDIAGGTPTATTTKVRDGSGAKLSAVRQEEARDNNAINNWKARENELGLTRVNEQLEHALGQMEKAGILNPAQKELLAALRDGYDILVPANNVDSDDLIFARENAHALLNPLEGVKQFAITEGMLRLILNPQSRPAMNDVLAEAVEFIGHERREDIIYDNTYKALKAAGVDEVMAQKIARIIAHRTAVLSEANENGVPVRLMSAAKRAMTTEQGWRSVQALVKKTPIAMAEFATAIMKATFNGKMNPQQKEALNAILNSEALRPIMQSIGGLKAKIGVGQNITIDDLIAADRTQTKAIEKFAREQMQEIESKANERVDKLAKAQQALRGRPANGVDGWLRPQGAAAFLEAADDVQREIKDRESVLTDAERLDLEMLRDTFVAAAIARRADVKVFVGHNRTTIDFGNGKTRSFELNNGFLTSSATGFARGEFAGNDRRFSAGENFLRFAQDIGLKNLADGKASLEERYVRSESPAMLAISNVRLEAGEIDFRTLGGSYRLAHRDGQHALLEITNQNPRGVPVAVSQLQLDGIIGALVEGQLSKQKERLRDVTRDSFASYAHLIANELDRLNAALPFADLGKEQKAAVTTLLSSIPRTNMQDATASMIQKLQSELDKPASPAANQAMASVAAALPAVRTNIADRVSMALDEGKDSNNKVEVLSKILSNFIRLGQAGREQVIAGLTQYFNMLQDKVAKQPLSMAESDLLGHFLSESTDRDDLISLNILAAMVLQRNNAHSHAIGQTVVIPQGEVAAVEEASESLPAIAPMTPVIAQEAIVRQITPEERAVLFDEVLGYLENEIGVDLSEGYGPSYPLTVMNTLVDLLASLNAMQKVTTNEEEKERTQQARKLADAAVKAMREKMGWLGTTHTNLVEIAINKMALDAVTRVSKIKIENDLGGVRVVAYSKRRALAEDDNAKQKSMFGPLLAWLGLEKKLGHSVAEVERSRIYDNLEAARKAPKGETVEGLRDIATYKADMVKGRRAQVDGQLKNLRDKIDALLGRAEIEELLTQFSLKVGDLNILREVVDAVEAGKDPPANLFGDRINFYVFVSVGDLSSDFPSATAIPESNDAVTIGLSSVRVTQGLAHEVLEAAARLRLRNSDNYRNADAQTKLMLERSAHTAIAMFEALLEGDAAKQGSLTADVEEQIERMKPNERQELVVNTPAVIREIMQKVALGGLSAETGEIAIGRAYYVLSKVMTGMSPADVDQMLDGVADMADRGRLYQSIVTAAKYLLWKVGDSYAAHSLLNAIQGSILARTLKDMQSVQGTAQATTLANVVSNLSSMLIVDNVIKHPSVASAIKSAKEKIPLDSAHPVRDTRLRAFEAQAASIIAMMIANKLAGHDAALTAEQLPTDARSLLHINENPYLQAMQALDFDAFVDSPSVITAVHALGMEGSPVIWMRDGFSRIGDSLPIQDMVATALEMKLRSASILPAAVTDVRITRLAIGGVKDVYRVSYTEKSGMERDITLDLFRKDSDPMAETMLKKEAQNVMKIRALIRPEGKNLLPKGLVNYLENFRAGELDGEFVITAPFINEGKTLEKSFENKISEDGTAITEQDAAYAFNYRMHTEQLAIYRATGGRVIVDDWNGRNVVMDNDGRAVGVDFGAVRFVNQDGVPAQADDIVESGLSAADLHLMVTLMYQGDRNWLPTNTSYAGPGRSHDKPIHDDNGTFRIGSEAAMAAYLDAMADQSKTPETTLTELANKLPAQKESPLGVLREAVEKRQGAASKDAEVRAALKQPLTLERVDILMGARRERIGLADMIEDALGSAIAQHPAGLPGVSSNQNVRQQLEDAVRQSGHVDADLFANFHGRINDATRKDMEGKIKQAGDQDLLDNRKHQNQSALIIEALQKATKIFKNGVGPNGVEIRLSNGKSARVFLVSQEQLYRATDGNSTNAYSQNGNIYLSVDTLQSRPHVFLQGFVHEVIETLLNENPAARVPSQPSDTMLYDLQRLGSSYAQVIEQGTAKQDAEIDGKVAKGDINAAQAQSAKEMAKNFDQRAKEYRAFHGQLAEKLATRGMELRNILGPIAREGELDNQAWARGIAALFRQSPNLVFRLAAMRGNLPALIAEIDNLGLPAEVKAQWEALMSATGQTQNNAVGFMDEFFPAQGTHEGAIFRNLLTKALQLQINASDEVILRALNKNPGPIHGTVVAIALAALNTKQGIRDAAILALDAEAAIRGYQSGNIADVSDTKGFVEDVANILDERGKVKTALVSQIKRAFQEKKLVLFAHPESKIRVTLDALVNALKSVGINFTADIFVSPEEVQAMYQDSTDAAQHRADAGKLRDAGIRKLRSMNPNISEAMVIIAKENQALWKVSEPMILGLMSNANELSIEAHVLNATAALLGREEAETLRQAVVAQPRQGARSNFVIKLLEETEPNISDIQRMREAAQRAA